MSLKSFHILFILISLLFGIFFGYWNYKEWVISQDNIYLFYSLIGILLCMGLFFYSKWFLKEISDIIDEIPILTFIASQAEGKTILKGANELRIKESDRLENMKNFIQGLKGEITMYEDGFAINGVQDLDEGNVITEDDHRVAMTAIIANIALGKKILPDNTDCIKDSYPTFFLDIESIGGMINE